MPKTERQKLGKELKTKMFNTAKKLDFDEITKIKKP